MLSCCYLQKSEWKEVDHTMLLYPTKVTILDLPAESSLCSITVSVWSPPPKLYVEQGQGHEEESGQSIRQSGNKSLFVLIIKYYDDYNTVKLFMLKLFL